jgi:hypothetical protein
MSLEQLLEVLTPGDYLKIFFVLFFWPILLSILHLLLFGRLPIGNIRQDLAILREFKNQVDFEREIIRQQAKKVGQRVEHDYDTWEEEGIDYDTGEVGANSRPSVRHPKNRDRANSSSSERIDNGSGQDS